MTKATVVNLPVKTPVAEWSLEQLTASEIGEANLQYFRTVGSVAECEAARLSAGDGASGSSSGSPLVENRTAVHASIVFFNILRFARNEVLILCGKLDNRVFGHPLVLAAAESYLKQPGSKLHIKVQNLSSAQNSIFVMRFSNFVDSGQIILTGVKDMNVNKAHFAVADQHAYRLEMDGAVGEDKFESSVQFDNKDICKILIDVFNNS